MQTPKLSIVTTMYYSAPYLEAFYRRVCATAEEITSAYEIIFVNDGSPDNALEAALTLYHQDRRVRVVDLSRNFGHHKAMMTGLAHAQGEMVFLIDCDLEERPELLTEFHHHFAHTEVDVVYGVQRQRQDGFLNRSAGTLFYKLFNLLSEYPIPENLVTVRLMSRRYVQALLQHQEREITIAGLWAITGFEQTPITIDKSHKNSSTYNLGRKFSILVNAITSFSSKPLVLIFYLGMFISLMASIGAFYLIIQRVFFGVYLAGWPSLIVSVWLLGGLIIFCIGVIGMYLAKMFTELKARPYTIIRQVYTHDTDEEEDVYALRYGEANREGVLQQENR